MKISITFEYEENDNPYGTFPAEVHSLYRYLFTDESAPEVVDKILQDMHMWSYSVEVTEEEQTIMTDQQQEHIPPCPVFDCLFNADGDCKEKHAEPGYCVLCDQGHGPLDKRSHNGVYRCDSCYHCVVFISRHE